MSSQQQHSDRNVDDDVSSSDDISTTDILESSSDDEDSSSDDGSEYYVLPGWRKWYSLFYAMDPNIPRGMSLIWAQLDALDEGRVSLHTASEFEPDEGDMYITFQAPEAENNLYVLIGYAIEQLRTSVTRGGVYPACFPAMRFR